MSIGDMGGQGHVYRGCGGGRRIWEWGCGAGGYGDVTIGDVGTPGGQGTAIGDVGGRRTETRL